MLAQAYGVVAPDPVGVSRAFRLLSLAGVGLGGRSIQPDRIRKCNAELIEAGIAVREANSGVRVVREWALPLTRAAHQAGNLRQLMSAGREEFRHYLYDPGRWEMELRCHLVAGNIPQVVQRVHRYDLPPESWRFLAEPFANDLIDTLPEPLRIHALLGCVGHAIETAAPAAPLIEACGAAGVSETRLLLDAEIAFVRILQGRFDSAEAVFAELPPELQECKPARIGLTATRALIAVLRGADDVAQEHIEAALALDRAGTRRRLVFPDCRAFALSLLGLVRIDTGNALDLLERIFRGAERAGVNWQDELSFVNAAKYIKSGRLVYQGQKVPNPRMQVLMDGLLSCWMDEYPADWQDRMALLRDYRKRAVANGFDWVSAECDEVLRHVGERAAGAGAGAGETCGRQSAGGGESGHQLLGTEPLVTLAAPVPDWEISLKTIERTAEQMSSAAAGKRKTAAPAKRRLVWILVDEGYDIRAYPREQKQHKNGGWTKGRKVSLQRLVQDMGKMDFLLPQDLEAAATASTASKWQGWGSSVDDKGIYSLAGHPHVFGEDGKRMEIARRAPELSIAENELGATVVTMQPYAQDIGEAFGRYLVRMVTDQRCEATHFADSQLRLLEAIPEEGLELPAEARPRLLQAVSSLAAEVRVQSDGGEEAAVAQRVDSDPTPCVRLEPFEDGLSIALVVEPIRDSGLFFEPGAGAVTVFASRGGGSVQARRDLSAERAALDRLMEQCPKLAPRPTELNPLILSDPEECLELLETLENAGARCLWPKGQPLRIVARVAAPSLALTVKSAGQWLQTSGKLAVDEKRALDLKQLLKALEATPGSRFVQLGGGQFLALTRTFRRQLDDLASLSTPAEKGEIRLHSLAALALDDLMDDAGLTADEDWRGLRANIEAANALEPELPSTLRAELRPYQIEGYRWLVRLARWGAGACLADDMGLGKTVQALALLLARAPDGPALVVSPTSVLANWVDEARRFAPTLNVTVYAGTAEHRERLVKAPGPFELVIATYGLLQNDVDRLAAIRWQSVVLDEAQAIKNPATKRARAARRLDAAFRLVTTGTPIQNSLMDLHSLFSFLNPGLLGSPRQFHQNYVAAIDRGDDGGVHARLRRLVMPFLLRRLKADVLHDLPERTEITLHVRMSTEEATLYEALRQRAIEELEAARAEGPDVGEAVRRFQVLAHLTRLRLACCNPRLVLDEYGGEKQQRPRSSKLETFAGILSELIQNGHKVLVFSQFVRHLKLVEEYIAGIGVAYHYLDGSTPQKDRAERISAFQAGDGDVFLISLKAGGFGLNLTAADYVIHLDPWWNPAVEDQASDRAHRIGQRRPVTIYRLVTEGTIEEQIVDLHRHKRDLADRLLEGADSAGRLSADELLGLLRHPRNN